MSKFVSQPAGRSPGAVIDPALKGSFVQRIIKPALVRAVQFVGRFAPASTLEQINAKLTIAGHPGNISALDYLALRVLMIAIGFGLGFYCRRLLPPNSPVIMVSPVIGAVFGYMAINAWLAGRMQRRQDAIQRALPDALDMLTICVEAGLAFESALQRVSDQWTGPLSNEFARTVAEVRLGVPRPQSLRRLAARCACADVSSFVAVLVQADAMGTSISHVLHSQSEQMRVLRRQRAEEKANKAPIKMLIPMVLFILPALFVVILGPAVPKVISAFSGIGGY